VLRAEVDVEVADLLFARQRVVEVVRARRIIAAIDRPRRPACKDRVQKIARRSLQPVGRGTSAFGQHPHMAPEPVDGVAQQIEEPHIRRHPRHRAQPRHGQQRIGRGDVGQQTPPAPRAPCQIGQIGRQILGPARQDGDPFGHIRGPLRRPRQRGPRGRGRTVGDPRSARARCTRS
jgi:hypothetical protein